MTVNLSSVPYCTTFADHDVCWGVRLNTAFYSKVLTMALIILIGLVGNLLLSFTILLSPRLRAKSINLFIINLSLSNLLNLVLVAPLVTTDSVTEFFVLGELGCRGVRVLQTMLFIVPMLTLLVISLDRFLAIRFPFRDLRYNRKALFICSLVWLVGAATSTPQYNTKLLETYIFKDVKFQVCYDSWDLKREWQRQRIYKFSLLSIMFIIPFTGLLIFYSGILIKMRRLAAKIGVVDAVHRENMSNIAKMVILVILTTTFCWLPLTTYWILKE